jgi:hypothetical protein
MSPVPGSVQLTDGDRGLTPTANTNVALRAVSREGEVESEREETKGVRTKGVRTKRIRTKRIRTKR